MWEDGKVLADGTRAPPNNWVSSVVSKRFYTKS